MKTLFVNGTLMRGFGLPKNLNGAEFLGAFMTKPCYRVFSINDVHPGMYEVQNGGVAVEGELYRIGIEVAGGNRQTLDQLDHIRTLGVDDSGR